MLPGFAAPAGLTAATLADLDADGKSEILVTTESGLSVFSGSGASLWSNPGVGGVDVVVGQMDDDAPLEIATTGGDVVDAATHQSQWHWPAAFGFRLRADDIDVDGRDELIAAENWYFVWAYDVEHQLPKWSISYRSRHRRDRGAGRGLRRKAGSAGGGRAVGQRDRLRYVDPGREVVSAEPGARRHQHRCGRRRRGRAGRARLGRGRHIDRRRPHVCRRPPGPTISNGATRTSSDRSSEPPRETSTEMASRS